MTYGLNLSRLLVENEIIKSDREEHLNNIRKQTGLNYQIIELANNGYRLEVQPEKEALND